MSNNWRRRRIGWRMRKSLGMAVFAGMLGGTVFGIVLTPVFYRVLQGLGESRLFESWMGRWIGTCGLCAGLGALVAMPLTGWLTARHGSSRICRWAALGCCLALFTQKVSKKQAPHSPVARCPSDHERREFFFTFTQV